MTMICLSCGTDLVDDACLTCPPDYPAMVLEAPFPKDATPDVRRWHRVDTERALVDGDNRCLLLADVLEAAHGYDPNREMRLDAEDDAPPAPRSDTSCAGCGAVVEAS